MAYDANDPADKKIVADAVKAALATAEEEHTADVAGLKAKNTELIDKLKKAEKGENNAAEVSRLETELETAQTQLKDANKGLKAVTKERDEFKTSFETESKLTTNLLVDGGLTEALAKAKVAPEFLPAAKALLASQVTIKTEGDTRKAVVGDKALGDFVTEWSQGDNGKHFVSADNSTGGGANGGKANGQAGKTITRAAYEANPGAHAGFFASGGTLTD